MQKSFTLFALAALFSLVLIAASASAYSIWEPQYETYRLGSAAHGNGAYSSVETYEKVVVENEDRFGSDKVTTIKKTESESYTPYAKSSGKRYYDYDYDSYHDYDDYDYPRYIYTDSYGRTSFYDRDKQLTKDWDTYIRYDDGSWYPSTNFRFKETYNPRYYENEDEYGYDYYYKPEYDWHLGIYNWRY